ncbi:hypothetical protein [Rhodoferax sp. PAMC 29310]|uniref:hypothetical protein n=1 Tax=Rhodoferax sp. PAMC 29310 TaxID=2822760 RepID=UPI001B3337ED|nr:hypothetical protein [Rhodoferax sp. PAMC 29310]
MTDLQLRQVNENVYAVMTANGDHVGNLKRIGAIWKFKAIGYEASGEVIPGGGPLTDRHNLALNAPSAEALNAAMTAATKPL